ncbi:hypothetical protein BKA70DRAFT_1557418 [Coprinopsis sp. MPI-PUGE-AT-0042]|nr:hypothetical protein BKA70DRAFT_1557418 [Coprinopsis sp. MPI-PUGE-AT-0042]
MVEPLASLVKGSISKYPALQAASKSATAARKRNALSSKFFTPAPRQNLCPADSKPGSVTQCQEWSCCSVRHSLSCSKRDHPWDLEFECLPRSRKGRSPQNGRLAALKSKQAMGPQQRRHASMAAESPSPMAAQTESGSSHTASSSSDPRQLFLTCCQRGTGLPCSPRQAWTRYATAGEEKTLETVSHAQLFNFAENLLVVLEEEVVRDAVSGEKKKGKERADHLERWGRRILSVLDRAGTRLQPARALEDVRLARARAKALMGESTQLWTLIRDKPVVDDRVKKLYVLALAPLPATRTPEALYHMATEGVWEKLTNKVLHNRLENMSPIDRALRAGIGHAALALADPLETVMSQPSLRSRGYMLSIILCASLDRRALQIGTDVVKAAHKEGICAGPFLIELFVHALCKDEQYLKARDVLTCHPRPPDHPYVARLALMIASLDGCPKEAEKIISQGGLTDPESTRNLLLAYVNGEDMEGATRTFQRLFPPNTPDLPRPPTAIHFAAIFQGLVRHRNGNGMEDWITRMRARGVKANATAYGFMMEYYGQQDRPEDIVKLFEEMDREKVRADSVVYNVAMAYFSRRKDALTVESLFKRMVGEGIEPNSLLINTLMNAHVEAGSFAGVIKALKYTRARFPRVPLSIDTHNIVLKAYLYLGAPLDHILDEFDRLRELDIEADGYTYGTIIEAAYDMGRTKTAYALFQRCIALHARKPSKGYLSTAVFTTVISGLTEGGHFAHATAVFKDMIRFGFKPNSMTYGAVVKAFASQGSKGASSLDAERLIEELLAREDEELWKLPINGQSTWYEQLYAPLFHRYRWQSARDVESIYQSIVDKGEKPTLFMMTYLMDAYRRERNINKVLDVWPHIVQHGLRYLNAGAALRDAATVAASQNAQPPILAMALSIYMRACTSAGQHAKVAEAWKEFQKHNLRVDPWNWLDLVNSLIRAGEIFRAFELLEKVILPNRVAIQNYNPQFEEDPDTPLLFEETFVDQDLSTDLHRRPLWERPGREAVMHQKFRLHEKGDVIGSLETFFRHAPLRRVWRIPRVIPQRLLLATNSLDKGYVIRPTGPYERGPTIDPVRDPERARAILVSISANFPRAFEMLTKFKAILQKRLGAQYKPLYEETKVTQ